jgi:hypothetical protein
MKTPNFNSKNNKTSFLACIILLTVHCPVFSQNKLLITPVFIDYLVTLPIVCVLGLAAFLITAFMKQKNH